MPGSSDVIIPGSIAVCGSGGVDGAIDCVGDFGPFLEFETLTLCPIDTRCIERSLLRADEVDWLNAYHATVRERLAPRVSGTALAWLNLRTQAL